MGGRMTKKVLYGILAMLLSAGLFQSCLSETLAAYYSSYTLQFNLSPDLSQVPTPTIEPTPTPAPTASGTGLVFGSSCSISKVEWDHKYHGDVTDISMSVDNINHKMHFDIVFTVPDGYTKEELNYNRNWFSGFYITLSAINQYDGKASLAGIGSSGGGTGVSQLQHINLKPGDDSDKIKLYFYNGSWKIPEYDVNGNTVIMKTKESYTNIGINIDHAPWYYTEKYYSTATITLVLPSQTTAQIVGDALVNEPAPAVTSDYDQAGIPTVTPTSVPTIPPTAVPSFTATAIPTATPVATSMDTVMVSQTDLQTTTPTATRTTTPAATSTVTPSATSTGVPAITPSATSSVTPAATSTGLST